MYKTVPGDTFEIISRKVYGTETRALDISEANPGVVEPITSGTQLVTPTDTSAPKNVPSSAPATDEDEVSLLVAGERFRFWSGLSITRAIDTMDTVTFEAPFDSKAPGFKESFRPFSYKNVDISVGGELLFTGTMVGVDPILRPDSKSITVSGYSLPGVLQDCTAPASAFPLEFNGQTLEQIATKLVKPFGISVVFEADVGPVFDTVACEPGRRVLNFLADLAKQRNLIVSSSKSGALVFLQATEYGSPVAVLRQGESPVMSVSPFFNPQSYYSHITGIEPVLVGLSGSQVTVKNNLLTGVMRPLTFNAPDTEDSNIKEAVSAKAGRMFGNMAFYEVSVNTWRDPSGELWTPNTIVKLIAPDAMIYSEYAFVLRNVEFKRTATTTVAVLNLVMPGSFNGKIPKSLPWD